ncbi:MAG: hypothetical protein IK078_06205, partial [Lachnospiraceae bacterium]|nr:hypothetical protein [Lachnospiraceae bacterium]
KLSEEQKAGLKTDPNKVFTQKPEVPFNPQDLCANDNPFRKCRMMMEMLGVMEAKFALELGHEQLGIEESLEEQETDPEKRSEQAAFLIRRSRPKIMRMYQEFDSMRSSLLSLQEGWTRQAFLGGNNPVDEQTTMGQLADKLDLTMDERAAFLKNFGCKDENKKAMVVFKGVLQKRIDEEKNKKSGRDQKLINTPLDDVNVMFYMIKNCNEYLVQTWYARGFHLVKNTAFGVEAQMFEKGRALQSRKEPDYRNIQDWIRNKGQRDAEKKKVENIGSSSKQLIGALTSEKKQKIRSTRGMNDVFEMENFDRNPEFLNGVIARLESTKQGTSIDRFLWHRKNTGTYESMLKAVKAYEKAVFEKKTGEAVELREEMLEKCYAYIEGKEKKRWHDFGKERYNLALMLIRTYDSWERFTSLCDKINRARDVEVGDDDYMDGGALERFKETYGITNLGKERIHEKTRHNATFMLPDQEKRFAVMETLYTKEPKYPQIIREGFTEDQFNKLKKIDVTFHRISDNEIPPNAQPEGNGLSDRDFAAIAYGAALSEKAVGKEMKCFPKGIEKKDIPELFSDRYTSKIMRNDTLPAATGMVAPIIQYGREQAKAALQDYGAGKKKKLAGILANALVKITEKYRIKREVDDELVADGEMAARMCNMLLRDKELLKEALSSNPDFHMGHLRMVSSINHVCELYARSTYAKEKINEAAGSGQDTMTPDEKKQLMTDVVSYMTAKQWMEKRTAVLFKNMDYVDESNQLTQTKANLKASTDRARENLKRKNNGSLINLKGDDAKQLEKIQAQEKEIEARIGGKEKLLKKKYVKDSVMIDQMKETEAIESIHRESAKFVRDKLTKMNISDEQLTPARMKEFLKDMDTHMKRVARPQAGDGNRVIQQRGINA